MDVSQDELLYIVALARLSYEFEDADQQLADRAWELAVDHAEKVDLTPTEAVANIEWSD
jgi:hypothetical protein